MGGNTADHSLQNKHVFFLESLPLVTDKIRHESEAEARLIGEYIYEAYSDLGYQPILIPAVSVEQRMNMVLLEITGSSTQLKNNK